MSAERKQIQSFNGLEEIDFKQGKGRSNVFSLVSQFWEKYIKPKVEDLIEGGSYTKLVGRIDSLEETLIVFENTTDKTWTLEGISTGNVDLTPDTAVDVAKTMLLIGGCPIPGSFVVGNNTTFYRIQFLDSSGITYTDFVVDFELRIYA